MRGDAVGAAALVATDVHAMSCFASTTHLPLLGKTSSPRGTHALNLLYGSLAGGKPRSSSGFRHLTWPVLTKNAQTPAPDSPLTHPMRPNSHH
ncbi:hypothetical protein PF005_g33213 [Phytophthora fragariae]|uniref:Uncharacterized protein n=1 Tax=Phytophthora fragariae TaxID=53985 RepID=A0A6A3PGW6_9STRA|nr:hypothetical protein PF009_g33051 [Phytophthora fragariae]KAE9054241.1 hypothetical protein PF007_g32690 [Phytophthora fragariae]KAE9055136.1 hypothetical protein PF010_g32263 [Phytophthora fragariae]KAE9056969.1 hypothetical protein PF006_g32545 [Phytophthora fragariae]KAE9156433.1 hypothetical protein PF005_g33213 [Phytophthora fragariae]